MILLPADIKKIATDACIFSTDDYIFIHYKQTSPFFRRSVSFEHNVLIYVLNGEKRISFESIEYTIKQGEAFFIPKNSYLLSEILDTQTGTYDSLLFFFPGMVLRSFVYKYKYSFNLNQNKKPFIFSIKMDRFLSSLFESFLVLTNLKNRPNFLLLKYEEIFLYLLEDFKNSESFITFLSYFMNTDFDTLNKSIFPYEFIYNNVSEIAKNAGISHSSFLKQFKRKTGLPPKEWMDNERFERARFMLEFSTKTVTDISQDLGFSSPSWFIERFKKRFGITPKKFQKLKNLYISQNK